MNLGNLWWNNLIVVLLLLMVHLLFQFMTSKAYHENLYSLFLRHKQQSEQHLILKNLDSAIFTLTDDRIKYFKRKGKTVLDQVVNASASNEAKASG